MTGIRDFFACLSASSAPAARLALVGDRVAWVRLLDRLSGRFRLLNFASLLPPNSVVPDIGAALANLSRQLAEPALVIGLDLCLGLLAQKPFEQAVYQTARWLESQKGGSAILLARAWPAFLAELERYSGIHRLKAAKRAFLLAPASDEELVAEMRADLLDESLAPLFPGKKGSLADWINARASLEDGHWHILVPQGSLPRAGVAPHVRQLHSLAGALGAAFDKPADALSEKAQIWLADFAKTAETSPMAALVERFSQEGEIGAKFLDLWQNADVCEREILFWLAREKAPGDSYLNAILNLPDINSKSFLQGYAGSFDLPWRPDWAKERRDAIIQAGIETFVPEIEIAIKRARPEPAEKIAPWLNCGSLAERAELLRRCAERGEIIPSVLRNYSELRHYLAPGPADLWPSARMEEYFAVYRKLVVLNRVEESFAAPADLDLEAAPARDVLLQELAREPDCALLVVDALGAEWTPMLLSMAGEKGLNIVSAQIARASLPTITETNNISWPRARLSGIKALDNLAHRGAEAHERRDPGETLAKMLEVPKIICQAVRKALVDYGRVVLTGDHGMSRLAALALGDAQIARPIPGFANPAGLRYCAAVRPVRQSPELAPSLDGQYLCVKNYDYFPKSGPRGFALHGGASPEERLAPVIVFAADKVAAKESGPAPQIIEDEDFDI